MKKEDDVKNGDVRRATFTVEGMDCADEVRLIEDKLGRLPGVENLQFDLMRRRLTIGGSITSSDVGGWFIAPRGLQAVRIGALDMNFLFLVLALVGWATLWMAVASDMGASLLVITNGLRALKVGD